MPRKRKAKRPTLIEVLPSLVKMVPEVRLERVENIYPVFEKRTICLKRDRISFQKAASNETETTSNDRARVSLLKMARLEDLQAATNDSTPTVPSSEAVIPQNQKVATNYNSAKVYLQKPEHQKAAANYNTARVYLQKAVFLENQKVATSENTGSVNLQKSAGVENQKVVTTDNTEKVNVQKTADVENQKVATSDNVPRIYLRKPAYLEKPKVQTNDNTAKVYLQKTACVENQKPAANDNTSGANDSDDDVNDDALFEYEVDLENLSQDVTIQTEVIKDDRQDSVVVVNLVPDVRPVISKQEEAVTNITSSDSVVPETNADMEQGFENIQLEAYSLANSAGEHAESNTMGNFEKQESDDDDIMVLLDTSTEESDSRKQQQSDNVQHTEEQSGSSQQESDSKPSEDMSILSTSWALADCMSAKKLSASKTEEVQVIGCHYDNNGKVNYPCSKCNHSFDTQQAFSAHDCSKSESKSIDGFICPWCEREYTQLKQLNQHVRSCWKGLLTCVICSVNVSGKLGMIKHLQDHKKQSRQSQTRENACLVCGLFDEKWNLIEHWRGHTGVNLLRCVVCKKILDLASLVEHINVHRRTDPECAELNWCQQCGLTFRNKAAFNHHRNGHSMRKYSHMCESCGMFFESFHDLEQHMLYHVDSNTVYKCSKCKKIYPFRAHFDIHCKTCFKVFGGTLAFTLEMGEKHLKIFKTHTLDLVRYAIKQDIVKAVTKVPPKEVPATPAPQKASNFVLVKLRKEDETAVLYTCQVCQSKFVGRSSFMRHWRDHTGYNPNKCIICSDIFAMPKLLEMHMSIAHAASCYKCTNCSMIFRTVLEHKYHTLAHLKNNLFFCEVCGAGFNEFNFLEYHVFTNHVKECEIRGDQPTPKSTPVVNSSTSTEEYLSTINGAVGNVLQPSVSNPKKSRNSPATTTAAGGGTVKLLSPAAGAGTVKLLSPVAGTGTVKLQTPAAAAGTANLQNPVVRGTVNLQSPVISSSNISSSSAVMNQVITVADPSPIQVNPVANVISKPSPNVGVVQQTSNVVAPQISLPDFYMCTVCKAISQDLPTMMAHTKTHES